MRHLAISIIGILACLVCGCDRHTDKKVTNPEVVGTWPMTSKSLAMLKRDGYKPGANETYTITFAADGSLTFASVLPEFQGGNFITTSGKWTLKHDVAIDNETKRTNCLDVDWTRREQMSFAQEDGKLVLWTYYGDPDSCEFIDYVKD